MESPSPKKKVMLISPNFGGGGAERSISKLSVLLTEKNYDVHFVVFNVYPGREQVYPIKGTLHVLEVPAGKSFVGKGLRLLDRISKAKRLKRELQIEVCISFLEGADYVNILSRQKEKVIISIRGSKENDEEISGVLGWVRKKILMPWLYRKADSLVCVSEGIKEEIERTFSLSSAKIKVIYNFYDVDAIRTLAREPLPGYAEKLFTQPCVITSGRLHPQKNQAGLIRSFSQLRKLGIDCKLVILGTGELKSQLVGICTTLGLSVGVLNNDVLDSTADVIFLGYQKNPWLFMSRSRLFILSSSWEGFPNALAEAMCLGMAVVSTNCPHGPGEMLSDERHAKVHSEQVTITRYGALLPMLKSQKDYLACADVMRQFLTDNRLSIDAGKQAERRIRSFSAEHVSKAWQDLIEEK